MRRVLHLIMVVRYVLGTSMLFHNFAMGHIDHNMHVHHSHNHQTATMHLAHDAMNAGCSSIDVHQAVCAKVVNQDTLIYSTYVPPVTTILYYYGLIEVVDVKRLLSIYWYEYQKTHPPESSIHTLQTIRLLI